ncbi:MAG TPA: hypothetical protein VKY73_16285 [Polyangiaceae bacterium]|nr:hypothetical protein [Polyangiaceae bacterium]
MNRVWVLAFPVFVGCGPSSEEEVSGQALALTAQENVESALRGASSAGSFVADSATLADLLSAVAVDECDSEPPCATGSVCEAECVPEAITVDDLREARSDVDAAIDDLVEVLRERVFTPENLESEDGSSATYRLGADLLCGDSAGTGVEDTGPDPECVEQADRLQIRLRLSSPSPGNVDVSLLLSAEQRNPATLELHRDHVGVVFDLGEFKATVDALGEELDGISEFAGRVGLELRKNAELDYSLRANVLETLEIGTIDDLGQEVRVSIGQSVPTFELRLDGNARRVLGSYDLGRFGVQGPLNAFRDSFDEQESDALGSPMPEKTYTGDIALSIAGIEGGVTLDGEADAVDLTGIGLGDESSTLEHDGSLIAQLDVNPESGRHFDLHVEKDDTGQTTMTLSPTLDVRLLLAFAPLADQLTELPSYALGDTLRFFFEGTEPKVQAEEERLRVVEGTLHLTSDATPEANVSVPAGSCLVESGAEAPLHELLGAFAVSGCQ